MAAPTSIATRLFKLANGGPSTHGSFRYMAETADNGGLECDTNRYQILVRR